MPHLRFDPTHEPEPTSHLRFEDSQAWQKGRQDTASAHSGSPIDEEFGPQSSLSVIIPARNEAVCLPRLVSEIILALRPPCTVWSKSVPRQLSKFEIIVVDDGSTDSTSQVLRELAATYPELRSLRLRATGGQSAAMVAGFYAARGEWLATLDADLQNDPADLIALWNALPGYDVALGWRIRRLDSWSKRLVSHLANQVRNLVLGQSILDTGCSVRIFPRDLALRLPLFQGVHRFLGPLFLREGCRVIQIAVNHRMRVHGRSHYNLWNRSLHVLVDLLGVAWLLRRPLVYQILSDDAEVHEHAHFRRPRSQAARVASQGIGLTERVHDKEAG